MEVFPNSLGLDYTRICRLCQDSQNIVAIQQTDSKTYKTDDFEIELAELYKAYEFFASTKVIAIQM